jgi:hypothetical protein
MKPEKEGRTMKQNTKGAAQKALIRLYQLYYREVLTPSNVAVLLSHIYSVAEGR